MAQVRLILALHDHQPVGNFGFVFEKAYAQAYLPFLEAMERHPRLHWNLHAPGILWEWMEAQHPDYIDRIGQQRLPRPRQRIAAHQSRLRSNGNQRADRVEQGQEEEHEDDRDGPWRQSAHDVKLQERRRERRRPARESLVPNEAKRRADGRARQDSPEERARNPPRE